MSIWRRITTIALALALAVGIVASGLVAMAPEDSKNVDLVYGNF